MTARVPRTGVPVGSGGNFATIAPYTIEEAYEVADAIARGDLADLRDELGDLCFRSYSMRAWHRSKGVRLRRRGQAITEKCCAGTRVFGDADARRQTRSRALGTDQSRKARAAQKRSRPGWRARRGAYRPARDDASAKLQTKAGQVGFDWNDPQAVLRSRGRRSPTRAGTRLPQDRRLATCCSPPSTPPVTSTRMPRPPPQHQRKFERRFGAVDRHWHAKGVRRRRLAAGNGCALGCRQGSQRATSPKTRRLDHQPAQSAKRFSLGGRPDAPAVF